MNCDLKIHAIVTKNSVHADLMRGSFKKLRKIYAQNITVKIEKAFQFLVCVDLREFHRKLISFLAFYLRQLAKYNMDTYIQINIILKAKNISGFFF